MIHVAQYSGNSIFDLSFLKTSAQIFFLINMVICINIPNFLRPYSVALKQYFFHVAIMPLHILSMGEDAPQEFYMVKIKLYIIETISKLHNYTISMYFCTHYTCITDINS